MWWTKNRPRALWFGNVNSQSAGSVKDSFLLMSIGASLLFSGASALLLFLSVSPSADPLPLHYTILFGIDWTGTWWWVYYVPATGAVVLFLNAVYALATFKRQRIVALLLVGSALYVQCLVLLASFSLRAINR